MFTWFGEIWTLTSGLFSCVGLKQGSPLIKKLKRQLREKPLAPSLPAVRAAPHVRPLREEAPAAPPPAQGPAPAPPLPADAAATNSRAPADGVAPLPVQRPAGLAENVPSAADVGGAPPGTPVGEVNHPSPAPSASAGPVQRVRVVLPPPLHNKRGLLPNGERIFMPTAGAPQY